MFFVFGISNGEKQLDYNETMICSRCGKFGRLNVYMTYMYFSLFFIPVIIWNRKYFAKSTCCNTVYSLSPEIGKKIRKGEEVEISEENLEPVGIFGSVYEKTCVNCGYQVNPDFEYCPKCGNKL